MWQCNDWYMHLYTKKKLSLDLINDGLSVGWLVDSVAVHFSFQTLIMIIPPHSNWIKNWMYCEQWLLLNRYTAIESHRIDSKAFHFISVFVCVYEWMLLVLSTTISRACCLFIRSTHHLFYCHRCHIAIALYCHDNF